MQLYNNFIGLDIGKFNFVVAIDGKKETKEYNRPLSKLVNVIQNYKCQRSN
jgi:hypothetical protein